MRVSRMMSCGFVTSVLAAALIGSAPCGADAASSLGDAWDFELFSVGDSIIGTDGWMGSNTFAVVTNLPYTFTATTQPMTNSLHTKVVALNTEGFSISNQYENTEGTTNVYIDTMYKVVPSDRTPAIITNQSDVQAAFYFNTNRQLVVYHSGYDDGLETYSNRFTVVTNAIINTSDWVRVTVYMDYLTDTKFGSPEERYFKVLLDGDEYTSPMAYVGLEKSTGLGGSWFLCANKYAASNYLSAVALSGTGFFDDFVVTGDGAEPLFGAGAVTITTSISPTDGHGGTISPVGPVSLPAGGTTNFNIDAAAYWYIASVQTNGGSMGISGASNTNISLASVTADIALAADFDPIMVQGIPAWWLAANGVPTNNPTGTDSDGDGVWDADEWPAMTDPFNPTSVFAVVVGQLSGTNYVQWISDAIDPDLAGIDFLIEKSTNLTEGYFAASPDSHPRPTVAGTNTWWEDAPALTVPEFFRIIAPTNAP